ncbi:MAG: TrbC/VirB2 family protein [Candidatus Campbellbacteria bacterium]|nr:TrbC/VirB2 family protein [Candidatus Campbellbacteria bacterium]
MNTFFQKNKKIRAVVSLALALFVFVVPMVIFAQVGGEGSTIENPLNNVTSIPALITIIVTAVKDIGYFVIVFFLIYSGFLFVKARGDPKGITDAKNTFLWTVVGAAVLLGAQILSDVIKNTVTQLGHRDAPTTQQDIV